MNSKTTWRAKLKLEHNVGACEYFMQTEFGGARSRDQNFTDRKWAKSWRIWIDISCVFVTNVDVKWFVILEHTINHFSFGYVRLPQLKYYFSCFASFFLFFFLLPLSTSKPLNVLYNVLYSKFERLNMSGSTFLCDRNRGFQVGASPLLESSKILNF